MYFATIKYTYALFLREQLALIPSHGHDIWKWLLSQFRNTCPTQLLWGLVWRIDCIKTDSGLAAPGKGSGKLCGISVLQKCKEGKFHLAFISHLLYFPSFYRVFTLSSEFPPSHSRIYHLCKDKTVFSPCIQWHLVKSDWINKLFLPAGTDYLWSPFTLSKPLFNLH